MTMLLTPAQIKPKSFVSKWNFFLPGAMASHVYVGTRLFPQSYCNRVHLHIVFVLYVLWVCRSVGVLSCVYVSQSFTYALHVVIYMSL